MLLWTLWWLLVAELLASLARWRGVALLGLRWIVPSAVMFAGLSWLLIGRQAPVSLASGGLGLLLFALLSLWRNHGRRPDTILASGERDGRRIAEVAIPLSTEQMPAIVVEPMGGSSTGVLVVHGAGNHKTFYAWPLLHGLADAGFAACAIDVDGHGDNPRFLAFPETLENVTAGVAWLRERYSKVVVLGISQGGCLAARAAADGLVIDALVILEAPVSIKVTKAVIRREARTVALPAAWALHRDVGTIGIVKGWRTKPTRAKIGTVDLIERLNLLESIGRVSCPLLLCYANNDAVVPRQQAHAVAAAAPQGTTFVMLRRATHLSLSIDRRTVRLVCNWLKQAIKA